MVEQGTDVREVEWQFDALDLRPVARWLDCAAGSENGGSNGRLAGFSVVRQDNRRLEDLYLDTENWSVFRAGYALRVRHKGDGFEATCKRLDAVSADGPTVRREVSEPLSDADPGLLGTSDGPVGRFVAALSGGEPLKTLFRVETDRTTYRITASAPPDAGDGPSSPSPDTERVAELALDRTGIPVEGEREPVRLRRVELEVKSGSPEVFEPFVERLAGEFRLSPASASKFEAGVIGLDLDPPGPPDLGSDEVSSDMSAGELAFAVLRKQFRLFLLHEPGTRLGEDPEELHDMRVASRRMRAAMKVFEGVLPLRAARFREELKWIAASLGEVRDLDVQLEGLEDLVPKGSGASPGGEKQLAELSGVLLVRREAARRRMLRTLDSGRYGRFVESFSEFLQRGPSGRSVGAGRPALVVGPELVWRYRHKVFKKGDGISPGSPAEDYHELRKRGKRLRYTLEFLSDLYGKPAREAIAVLKSFQDVLGEHQDLEVAAAQLRELAPESGSVKGPDGPVSSRTFFFMGTIAARCEARAEEVRASFPEVYARMRRAKGKKSPWAKLDREMERLRAAAERQASEREA